MLGHQLVGSGPRHVIALHDWLCDTSTWDAVRPLLDSTLFTWAFADLRGYGRSFDQVGAYSLQEAADDVTALAASLGWGRFAVVGHSMSSLVALHIGQRAPGVERVAVVGAPPPTGLGYDDATFVALSEVARGDDVRRTRFVRAILGDRLSNGWVAHKVARWRQTSDGEAVAGYLPMFGRHGLAEPTRPVPCHVLAVSGARDADVMRREAVTRFLSPIAPRFESLEIPECGHYPMQETPPYLAHVLERFLGAEQEHAEPEAR